MTTYFAALWRHINGCDQCSHASRGLCADGDRLLDAAVRAGGAS